MRKQSDRALDHGALRLLALSRLEQRAMGRNELCARLQSACERTALSVPLVIEMLDCLGYVRTDGFALMPTAYGLALLSAGSDRAAEVIEQTNALPQSAPADLAAGSLLSQRTGLRARRKLEPV